MKVFSKINPAFFLVSFVLPLGLFLTGVLITLFFVLAPYLNYKVSPFMASPVVPGSVKTSTGFEDFAFSEFSKQATTSVAVKNVPAVFSLTVPKFKINFAKVETNSHNLSPDHILGHYAGTSLPGQPGNALIYGHSVLPVFFNPGDYKTIFAKLPELSEGDKFYIDYSGVSFTYEVVKKLVLKPEQVNVFDPNPANLSQPASTVTLLTCVPPGTKTYRLLVIGKLVAAN